MTEKLQVLKEAQIHFLASLSMNKFPKLEDLVDVLKESEETQTEFIEMTFELETVHKYPVKMSLQKWFLKFLMDKLEACSCDISEKFFYLYCDLLQREKEFQEAQYHHFPLPSSNKCIIIKGDGNFLSGGTTGLSLWQAGFALAEWCLENRERLVGKTVLELGSGCGFTGMAIAAGCSAKQVIMTDGHKKVLQQLVETVNINCSEEKIEVGTGENQDLLLKTCVEETAVSVLNLPWENSSDVIIEEPPELIIAADVVYDPSAFKDLSNTLLNLLARTKGVEVILACTLRNEDTLNGLFATLGDQVSVNEEQPPGKDFFVYEHQFPVLFYRLTLSS
ncbi:protein-lysine N-methyltransferase EEF2KMT isoform X1 [Cloeon dipterum]|uniref:protein-lysine N-methyltransferase EEF2KMT isoform X1 n=2 Tax=Cloeon dipterum TaxID=197152 RepID=UPI00321FF5D9